MAENNDKQSQKSAPPPPPPPPKEPEWQLSTEDFKIPLPDKLKYLNESK